MQYSLTVENPDTGAWSELDLGDEKPAMNYQINNLNELKDRQAAYSQAIKLPLSDNNCRTLAFIDIFSARAVAAYSPRRCKLFCEGIEISPFGAQLIIDAVSDVIECQIVSRTRDLFIALDSAPMDNVDWSYVFMSYQSLYGSNAPTTIRHRFPLLVADNALGYEAEYLIRMERAYETRQLQECLPAVQFIDLVKYIFNRQGFNFKSDLYDDPEAMKDYIVCGALRNRFEQMNGQGALWTGNVQIPIIGNLSRYYDIPLPSQPAATQWVAKTLRILGGDPVAGDPYQMRYYAVQPCTARVVYKCTSTSGVVINKTTRPIWLRLYHFHAESGFTEEIGDGYHVTTSGVAPYTMAWEVEMNTGDYVYLTLLSMPSGLSAIPTAQSFEVTLPYELNTDKQFLLHSMGMVEGTGFKSHNEIIKTFLQTYGLLIDVRRFTPTGEEDDYREGDVYAYTFAELYRRKDAGRYVDWSDKVVMDAKNTAGFKTGNYARRNFIEAQKYRDEDTRAPERGYFDVNNEALEKEKTLFTLPLASGSDIVYYNIASDSELRTITTAHVRAMTVEKDLIVVTTRDFSTSAANPTLVRIDDGSANRRPIMIEQGHLNWSSSEDVLPNFIQDMPIARHRPISYQIERYYASLQKLLHDARTLKVQVYLDVLDIYNLDFFTPVYIEYFGAFFYISKINNFIAGRLTTVELVKL